ncbi:BREX-1 system adenine-specific DNA-methyltransferase PglX [Clostridium sp. CS001]|uniref:BREX-1 system adenine-specific DNA-methyltransferase PglX n=1 Tax=Clostridium sp. CS001 TaxID=2880648 RepID=UPI001CF433EF|nr:BREX-1 system adenine-specific DNA-methyltransferase PglX [Clostridium sp. CS001]MCB2290859.1 BREX-1 system adenine-specific DNA-methyltransferase PglX [Clostridium sp. CS001]
MNKNALKIFAIESRKELIEKIKIKAMQYGIEKDKIKNSQTVSSDSIVINGKPLSKEEKQQREKLIEKIKSINEEGGDGYKQIIEEVAYTWFNRFTALRFMEVNNYLPTKVRVLSSATEGNVEPELIKEASNVDLPVDKHKIYEMKLNNDMEGLFKYMIIAQCNSLNKILPYMFQEIGHYTELLLPNGLLNEGAFVRRLTDTKTMEESDWEDVEIIGWLYQYYISEKKDEVFENLKKNIKITKENIPSATQLFTPDWIVKYMVENSLGRLWIESHPDEELKSKWKYYLEEAEQEIDVQKQLEDIRNKNINPEEIKVFDCCMGSGHILVYLFEVLYDIYKSAGYTEREIPKLILTKNLYGLDIDDRASQLAYFAVMMKARSYNSRIFKERIDLNICSIQESNGFPEEAIEFLVNSKETEIEKRIHRDDVEYLINVFNDAKEYGSILEVKEIDFDIIGRRIEEIRNGDTTDLFELQYKNIILEKIPGLLKQGRIMSKKYDVACTNPPYMGNKGMGNKLSNFVKENYPDSKSDMFSCFIEKALNFVKSEGYISMITMESWMFLSSFQNLRDKIIKLKTITNLVHMPYLGKGGTSLGISFGTSAFIMQNSKIKNYKAQYCCIRYYETNEEGVPFEFPTINERYKAITLESFSKIAGMSIAYWVSENFIKCFENGRLLGQIAEPRLGMATADNNRFIRYWYEVNINKCDFECQSREEAKCSNKKWFPYNKGGDFRKWYGNNEILVNWENDGYEIQNFKDKKTGKIRSHNYNLDYIFNEGLTWTFISSANFGIRYFPKGFLFDVGGSSMFMDADRIKYVLGYLTTNLAFETLKASNPTLNFQPGNLCNMPIIISDIYKTKIEKIVDCNIAISKVDWDNFEISWDFKTHPFLKNYDKDVRNNKIETKYNIYETKTANEFSLLKSNEEELNYIFSKIYNLQDEMMPEVQKKDVTIREADKIRDIKSFISYAVGCMFGRYSLDVDGIVYSGGVFNPSKYTTFKVYENNIIPILSENYFQEDMVSKFIEFVNATFGEKYLIENLNFIAETLGKKSSETSKETVRRYFVNDFFKEHLKTYKKRPIYWMFTSGKQKAFNCFIYMHRYDKTTLSRIRTDYLHELQDRLDTERKSLFDVVEGDYTTKEKSESKKKLTQLDKQIDELKKYDEVLHHMADMQIEIDLDDGVVVNYEKFNGLLAKI